jgi:hypothetical protein
LPGSAAVQLNGLVDLNIGPYTITLDGQSTVFNGSDLWSQPQEVLFFQAGLDPTQEYTITLTNYNADAPKAQQPIGSNNQPCATVDELLLYRTTPAPGDSGGSGGSGGSNSSSKTGAIVGGVVGGVAALAIVGLLLWFFVFRRRHRRRESKPELSETDSIPAAQITPTPFPLTDLDSNATTAGSPLQAESRTNGQPVDGQTMTSTGSPVTPRPLRTPGGKRNRDALPTSAGQRASAVSAGQEPSSGPLSAQPMSDTSGGGTAGAQSATTQELVTILNERLRAEYRGETEEVGPPVYESVV